MSGAWALLFCQPKTHYCPACDEDGENPQIPASECFKTMDAHGGESLAHHKWDREDEPTTHFVEVR